MPGLILPQRAAEEPGAGVGEPGWVGEAGPAAPGAQVPGKPVVPWGGANPAQSRALADTKQVSVGHPTTFPRPLMPFPYLQSTGGRAPGGNQW